MASLVVVSRRRARASLDDVARRPCVDVHVARDVDGDGDETDDDDDVARANAKDDDAWRFVIARASSSVEVTTETTSTSGRAVSSRRARVIDEEDGEEASTMMWTTTRAATPGTTTTASARGRRGRVTRERADDGETVTWTTTHAVIGIAWTNAGDAVACATDDGGACVARGSDGGFVWTRDGDGGTTMRKRRAVLVCAGDDMFSESVAVVYDDDEESRCVVRVAHADVETPDDALRHPARVHAVRRRGAALATLCRDGAIRLWMRTREHRGPMRLTQTIQTPRGGVTPVVAFDWLDASEARYDYLYDFAIVGVDGERRAHVWTISDVDGGVHPLCARRPVVTHRGSMTLEGCGFGRTRPLSFDDYIVARASLTRRRDDARFVLASSAFGVVAARTRRDRPDALEEVYRVSLRGHAADVVDARTHPTMDILVTVDAAGATLTWSRREETGELDDACHLDAETREAIVREVMDERERSAAAAAARGSGGARSLVEGERHVETSSDGERAAFVDADGALVVGVVVGDSQLITERVETPTRVDASTSTKSVTMRWFDAGGGVHVLAVAVGTDVSIYAPSSSLYASTGKWWRRVASVTVTERANAVVSAMTWSAFGDVVYVVIDREIFVVGFEDKSVAAVAVAESRAAPSYHPTTLTDWMKRGRVDRARRCVRAMSKYLESNDADGLRAFSLPNVLLDANEKPKKSMPANTSAPAPPAVPEFDMSAFGSFGGGMPATPAPATFSFGSDAIETATSLSPSATRDVRRAADSEDDAFGSAEAEAVAELVSARADRLSLTPSERVELLGVIDALRRVDERGSSSSTMDDAGRRVAASFVAGHSRRGAGAGDAARGRDACWAMLSDTKRELLDHLLGDAASGVDWSTVKRLGTPLWMDDDDQLRELIEKCAKGEFARTKNADDCALFFIVVDRVKVLAGLYKATQNKPLYEFMCRDFSETRHREAALKNAYALLSKHRYVFAAAFFILGGRALDAASIVWKHERDVHLTLIIARLAASHRDGASVHSSPHGHLNQDAIVTLERDVVPSTTDTWTLAAVHWITGRRDAFLDCVTTLMDDARDVDAADLLTRIIEHRAAAAADAEWTSRARDALRRASPRLAHSLRALGAPVAALERAASSSAWTLPRADVARLAVAALKGDDTDDDSIDTLARDPYNVDADVLRASLSRRARVETFEGFPRACARSAHRSPPPPLPPPQTPTPGVKTHARAPSALPAEIRTVRIPRVPSAKDIASGSPTEKVASARSAFSKLRKIAVKTKTRVGDDSPRVDDSPRSAAAFDDVNEGDRRVFRTPVDVASLRNDGFYDFCFNHEIPYELACASVRQGLSVVNLRALNDDEKESDKDAWALLLRAQPPAAGFKSFSNAWLHTDESEPPSPTTPHAGHHVREHEWATHAGLDMTSLTGIIPQSPSDVVGRNRTVIKREPANDVVARSVAAHPSRSFFAVGTSFGGVQLWDFHGANAEHAAAVFSLGGKKSTSGTGASTRALAWSPHGARLAACTSDGRVTLWLGDAPDVEPAASKPCGFTNTKTEDVLFLSTNVMAIASSTGSSSSTPPESVALWDALQPARANLGVIRAHAGGCTALAQLSSLAAPYGVPWPFLLTGGYDGSVAAHDLRMLGGDADATVLWRAPPRQDAASVTSIAAMHRDVEPLVVTGDLYGNLTAHAALDGTILRRVTAAHAPQKFLTPRGGGALASLGVSKILPLHDGVLTAGGDGVVRCFRLTKPTAAFQ